jgi:hypothetical protein
MARRPQTATSWRRTCGAASARRSEVRVSPFTVARQVSLKD